MRKSQLCNLFLVATMATLFGCQSNNNIPPPAPPEAPSQDKVPCREDECDYEEAGEEAKTQVIEASSEEKSASVDPAPSSQEEIQATNSLQEQPSQEATAAETPPSSESAEIHLDSPSSGDGPTTHMFEYVPSGPISENTVVLK